jgi:serine/threonine protein kinase
VTNATDLHGRYRIEESIASGGMGSVFAATDTSLQRRVAVKVLRDDLGRDEGFVERFRREAMAAAALSHPNIATIFDYGQDGSRRFIVMELVPGEDLGALLRREGRFGCHRAATIAAQIADALAYAHTAGIVHRDIKPGNIMIEQDDRVKVTDFGIARASGDASLTAAGSILGTVDYMSPEQARGDATGPATDIYSLGVVLYEMLVGVVPFTADSPISVALRHVSEDVPAPSQTDNQVSSELDVVVRRATAKDPHARFATAAEMATALRARPSSLEVASTAPIDPVIAPGGPVAVLPDTVSMPESAATRKAGPFWVWGIAAALLLFVVLRIAIGGGTGGPSAGSSSTRRTPGTSSLRRTIPAVSNLPLAEALVKLRAKGLVPHEHMVSTSTPKGIALYTSPAAGQRVHKGAAVALYVSSGPPAAAAKKAGGPSQKGHKGKHEGDNGKKKHD